MLESKYQGKLIDKLHHLYPGCIILKNDARYLQGVPDLIILYRDRWAALEVKTSKDAPKQPNQDFYVTHMRAMSFAAFIYPENESVVLDGLQEAFRP
jgi:hypothetical protein